MAKAYPNTRSIRHAISVLDRLPLAALPDLVESLIERLDAAELDPDLEPETDACDAGECGGLQQRDDGNAGDLLDAEPDDDDRDLSDDEPRFPDSLRLARDGLVTVRRRASTAGIHNHGRPAEVRRMRCGSSAMMP